MSEVYETNRLLLRVLSKEDTDRVLSFCLDNRESFEPWEPIKDFNFYTPPYQKASLTAEKNLMTDGKLLRYWIFRKESPDEIIGSICFQNILHEPYRSCLLGYKLSHRYRHQGYATEALNKCIKLAFEEHLLHRIEAYIMESNEPSLQLIKRLGFYYEGLAFSYARINGIWSDHRRYVLINPNTGL
jgi:[ribosomal protein S5]-alanine N-acetyltransferase